MQNYRIKKNTDYQFQTQFKVSKLFQIQMKGQQLFTKKICNFHIKYEEKTSLFANRSRVNSIQQQRQPLYFYGRNRTRNKQLKDINYKSIDTSELQRGRKKQRHVLSQDTEQLTRRQASKRYESISFRQKIAQKSSSEKQNYQKIPIQYSVEINQISRSGRIVYKGSTPKNSYFLMSFLKQASEILTTEPEKKNSYETDLKFNSKFESGNLLQAIRISKKQYWLYMREDTNTKGLKQWYFFQVICNRPLKATFRIYKFNKRYSLYKKGMKPYIKQNQSQWSQKGEDVKYNYDQQQKCFFLQFSYQFKRQRQRILVATMPPYTFTQMTKFIGNMIDGINIHFRTIGKSLGGVEIPLIQIVQNRHQRPFDGNVIKKKAIIILGRTHPAQTCSNFSIQAIIQRIKFNEQLQKCFDFFIVPITNPDGVILGNHRTSLVGVDLNRKFDFNFAQKQLFPEVQSIKALVRDINISHQIQFLIDLHGHSAKENMFAYGEQQLLQSEKHLKSRIIPKLLSQKMESFVYKYCVFQSYKQKKATARVYFSKKYNINTLTVEQSYGLIGRQLIGIGYWRSFGQILVQVLKDYAKNYMGRYQKMEQMLAKQIQEQKKQAQLKSKMQTIKQQKLEQRLFDEQKNKGFRNGERQNQVKSQMTQDQAQSLSSGDQQLQNGEIQLQLLRKRIFVHKNETKQRQSYVLSDKSIQLQELDKTIKEEVIHEHKLPLVSRIMRMQSKRQTSKALIDILTQHSKPKQMQVKQKIKQLEIKLPNLSKYI